MGLPKHRTGRKLSPSAFPAAWKPDKLIFFSDQKPGIRRLVQRGGFSYTMPGGRKVTAVATLRRITALVIPPAWTEVWICPAAHGYLQATGRDARGRKQYLYHPSWQLWRKREKFGRLAGFAACLPRLRRRLRKDLAQTGLPREKVLAAVVRLLDDSLIRIGNDEYARQNHSYGLTTLRNDHAKVSGSRIRFSFRGKSGKNHDITLEDQRLARIIRRCQELPGQELFEYIDDDGHRHDVGSADVNAYLRTLAEGEFTAKDFRLWHGTVLAAAALRQASPPIHATAIRAAEAVAVKNVAHRLGNTPAVCRASYIHPAIFRAYEHNQLPTVIRRKIHGLREDENFALAILRADARSRRRTSSPRAITEGVLRVPPDCLP